MMLLLLTSSKLHFVQHSVGAKLRRFCGTACLFDSQPHRALSNPVVCCLLLLQALSAPDVGETLVGMLVLDHAKLDAAEAAKAGRGGGGGMGGAAGLLSGLLGMTAEEVMGAMVAAAVERCVSSAAESASCLHLVMRARCCQCALSSWLMVCS